MSRIDDLVFFEELIKLRNPSAKQIGLTKDELIKAFGVQYSERIAQLNDRYGEIAHGFFGGNYNFEWPKILNIVDELQERER